jgi:hypothetical protein
VGSPHFRNAGTYHPDYWSSCRMAQCWSNIQFYQHTSLTVIYTILTVVYERKCVDVFRQLDIWAPCSRDGAATAGLTSERPETLYLFQKHLLCWKHEYIVSRNKIILVRVTFCVFFYNLFLLNNFCHSTPLHCWKQTARSCQFSDNVFETDRKWLELRALCFSPDQLAYSPPRCQGSSYLTRKI